MGVRQLQSDTTPVEQLVRETDENNAQEGQVSSPVSALIEQKPGRRIVSKIVSKEEFVSQVGKKIGLSMIGIAVCSLSGAACILLTIVTLVMMSGTRSEDITLSGISLLISCLFFWGGTKISRRAQAIKTGVPLTRHNSADLPAEESLVRASQEPIELQQTVLLRASGQSDTTPPELLLRPTSTEQADTDIQSKLPPTAVVWKTPIEETHLTNIFPSDLSTIRNLHGKK